MAASWNKGGTILIRIGPHHFAFLRGYFEGLPLPSLSRRYLETSVSPDPDLRIAKSTLRWIREQLMFAARRRGLFAEARLILLDPDKLRSPEKREIPTLEEFREIRDPHELFSEAELMELFHEEYGGHALTDRRTARNDRLRRRQIAALLELEKLLGAPPCPTDDVTGWLHPALAKRLQQANLLTLGDLVKLINARGYRWWTQIPRFGEKAAAQVVAWLSAGSTVQGLGIRLGKQALVKERKIPKGEVQYLRSAGFGMHPLEHLELPPGLDGKAGTNRSPRSTPFQNDQAAIAGWLAEKSAGSATQRSYRKEAERFLLWMTLERQKSMSSADREDCSAYLEFLTLLGNEDIDWPFRIPRSEWIAPRTTRRWSESWRPFEGRLSAQSIHLAKTILGVMGDFLLYAGYWLDNPWRGLETNHARKVAQRERRLTESEWAALWTHLETSDNSLDHNRLRFITLALRDTGLRLSDLANAKCGDITVRGQQLVWMIRSGTDKATEVEMSEQLAEKCKRYLAARGYRDLRILPLEAPLVARKLDASVAGTHELPLSEQGLYLLLKNMLHDAARDAAAGLLKAEPDLIPERLAETYRQASPSWLKKTNGRPQR